MKTFQITFKDGTQEEIRATDYLHSAGHICFFDGNRNAGFVAESEVRIVRIMEEAPAAATDAKQRPGQQTQRRGGK